MRIRLLILLALAAAGAALALAATRHGREAATAAPPPSELLLVGDSLNVGVEPYLRELLDGWAVRADDEVGRPTSVGLDHLRSLAASLPPYVVVSLGTNDPSSAAVPFRDAVREVLALAGPRRCVVWATIHRDGGAYGAFNAALRDEARRAPGLRVVGWDEIARSDAATLAPDGIHGTPDGYRARAQAVVAALRACHDEGVTA